MAWTFGGLTFSKVVPEATDEGRALRLRILVTATERAQLQEMAEFQGDVQEFPLAGGGYLCVDTSGGSNTFYLTSDAESHVTSGWFAIRSLSDEWASVNLATAYLDLVRLGADTSVAGSVSASTEFLSHDF